MGKTSAYDYIHVAEAFSSNVPIIENIIDAITPTYCGGCNVTELGICNACTARRLVSSPGRRRSPRPGIAAP